MKNQQNFETFEGAVSVWFALLPTLTSCAATAAAVPESCTNECGVQGQDYNGAQSVWDTNRTNMR